MPWCRTIDPEITERVSLRCRLNIENSTFSGWSVTKKNPIPSWGIGQNSVFVECYGLGISGIVATPLLGLGISGIVATPLLGLGMSGIVATPLFGLGMSGIVATPLLFRETAKLVDATAMSVITRALIRFRLVDIVVPFEMMGLDSLDLECSTLNYKPSWELRPPLKTASDSESWLEFGRTMNLGALCSQKI